MLRSGPYPLRTPVAQPEPRQTTGPSVTCVYHTYALIATPASPSQTIGITPFQHIHRAAPIPRRQGWPAKARNIRAFAMAIIEVLPRRLRERIEQLGAIGRDPAGGLTPLPFRSGERRVGKECRSRWSPY